MLLMPMASLLEKLALRVIRDDEVPEKDEKLDERLLVTPALPLSNAKRDRRHGKKVCQGAWQRTLCLESYSDELADKIRRDEEKPINMRTFAEPTL